jgi:hypothetical protein
MYQNEDVDDHFKQLNMKEKPLLQDDNLANIEKDQSTLTTLDNTPEKTKSRNPNFDNFDEKEEATCIQNLIYLKF